jgi:hypothetical protein
MMSHHRRPSAKRLLDPGSTSSTLRFHATRLAPTVAVFTDAPTAAAAARMPVPVQTKSTKIVRASAGNFLTIPTLLL